ncbi:MAG: hypothetical protein LBE22_02760 [Azoarcus sp.]|nr:hypothetical protein [Azoarcus sp.]
MSTIAGEVPYISRTAEAKPKVAVAVNLGYRRRPTNKSPHLSLLVSWKIVSKPVGKT